MIPGERAKLPAKRDAGPAPAQLSADYRHASQPDRTSGAQVSVLFRPSLEEEPDLRDRWATMLANFANEESGVGVHKSFVNVLSELTPLEVNILDVVYSLGRANVDVAGTNRPFGTGILR
jgi:hypothetical protein